MNSTIIRTLNKLDACSKHVTHKFTLYIEAEMI